MDPIDLILTRSTVPQVKMGAPGPDAAQLERILAAGLAAPDHGKLRPWRFLVIEGRGREALGELFARAAVGMGMAGADVEKQRAAPLRAPLIIAVVAKVEPEAKIPEVEQIASSAAAAQNMLLAAHALGFAGKWSTGKNAYDPTIRQGLGLAPADRLVAFLYIGKRAVDHPLSPRPAGDGIVERWNG
jgi:nitroreductase